MTQFAYTFDGADTAVGSGIPAPVGLPALVAYSGSWRRLANKAFSDTAHASRPMLGLDPGGNGNFDLSVKVSPFGGDALYARWIDASNWLCARVRRYQQTNFSGYTEYRWRYSYAGTSTTLHGQTLYSAWSTSSANPGTPATFSHTHDGVTHTMSYTSGSQESRYIDTSTTSTLYQVVLEKSVSGTVTTLGTVTASAGLTKLRLRGIGSELSLFLNDSATANLTRTDSAHLTATKHGVGRGPSELSGTSLDDLFLDNLNSPPNAPQINVPAAFDLTRPLVVQVPLSDPDAGDSASASFLRWRQPAVSLVWTVITRLGSNTAVTLPADSVTAGQVEFQGANRDAQGLPVGDANLRWSASRFSQAGTTPAGLAFTSPLPGAALPASTQLYEFSATDITASEWRVLADLNGAPDPTRVLDPGNLITDPAVRSFTASGLQNGSTVHAQVRGYNGLLVGDWVTLANPVAYVPPDVAAAAITELQKPATINVRVINTTPAGGQPQVTRNILSVRVSGRPGTAKPRAVVAPGGIWQWRQFASGINYELQIETVGDNGTRALSAWLPLVPTAAPVVVGEGRFADARFDPARFSEETR